MSVPTTAPLPLSGIIQHYAWGGFDFIPDLLGQQNADRQPTAELWLGAHPKGPAEVLGQSQTLDKAIANAPEALLGQEVSQQFQQRLPFLLKVLDVRQMLSIQVHPTKAAAEIGFRQEEQAGIPRTAPNRNYRDNNHKPELGVALTDFYLLHGFKSSANISSFIEGIPGWEGLLQKVRDEGVPGLYRYIMSADQVETDQFVNQALNTFDLTTELSKESYQFWTKRAIEQYSKNGHHDRGLFSIWWMNIVHLAPGEGIFQDAGIPHAYLEGACIELMANSDNVLRGGLTPKHIDVTELLKHTKCTEIKPRVLKPAPTDGQWERYPTPVADFALSCSNLNAGEVTEVNSTHGPSILFLLKGKLSNIEINLNEQQRALFIPAGQAVKLTVDDDNTVVYRASVGTGK